MNIKIKFRRIICFILIFMMFVSSASFGTSDGNGSKQNHDAMAGTFANGLANGTKLKELQWEVDGTKNAVFFAELPRLDGYGNIEYIPGTDSYKLIYTAENENGNKQPYNCNIKLLIDGKEVAVSDKLYYYDGYGPMIQIPGIYDSDRAADGDYSTSDSLKGYEGKKISIEVEFVDENNKVVGTATSSELTVDDKKTTVENLSEGSPIWEAIKDFLGYLFAPVQSALKLLERICTILILAIGDGILAMVSSAVGEPVTIDSVILGDVQKVSIDFWQDEDGMGYMASVLKVAVNQWYGVFRSIAVLVYIMLLLIIGIKILFASTAGGKAKYKDLLKDWVIGICLLFLFPYAMRMLVNINDILVSYVASAGNVVRTKSVKVIQNDQDISSLFGEDGFVEAMIEEGTDVNDASNTMLYMRNLARIQGRIPLALVYLIMIFQLIVILCTYYKRAFMVAFLIVIFPLVAMTYTLDKMTKGLAHTGAFNTWFKEFFVNVFVQLFHAVTYVIIVNAGVVAYINTQNWFFMVLCIAFLFQGEKILRKIFGVESSVGTMKDIGASAMAAYGMMKKLAPKANKNKKKSARENGEDDWSEDDEDEETDGDEVTSSTPRPPVTQGAITNMQAAVNGSANVAAAQRAQATGVSKARKVANLIGTAARNTVPKKLFNGAVNVAGATFGAVMGATYGLAAGDAGKAITYGIGGMAVGKGLAKTVAAPIKGISNVYAGHKLKKAVMRGDYDEAFKSAGIDMNSMEAKTAALIRKALAEQTGAAASRGEKVGEYKFWKTIEKNK